MTDRSAETFPRLAPSPSRAVHEFLTRTHESLHLFAERLNVGWLGVGEISVVTALSPGERLWQYTGDVPGHITCSDEVFLKQGDHAAVPRRIQPLPREYGAGCVERGVIQAVQSAIPSLGRDEHIGVRERFASTREAMAGERVLWCHSATPSRRTVSINGVSRHTGWWRMASVITEGEMKTLNARFTSKAMSTTRVSSATD